MKYNRSEIMKAAWRKFRRFDLTFAQALRMAWMEARDAAPIWAVYGDGKQIASGLTYDRAGALREMIKFDYWNTAIKAA